MRPSYGNLVHWQSWADLTNSFMWVLLTKSGRPTKLSQWHSYRTGILACLVRDAPMGSREPCLRASELKAHVFFLLWKSMNMNHYLINDNEILSFVSTMLHNQSIMK